MAKQKLTGKVVSNKMQKTVVVEIERRIAHPVYKKRIKITNKIKADAGDMTLMEGDIVNIESTRPISKTKNFRVVSRVEDEKKATKTTKASKEAKPKKGGKK